MLTITIPEIEMWNESTEEFVYLKEKVIKLEHSLLSVSKWEAMFNKPFLDNKSKSDEELIEYIKCMSINGSIDDVTLKSFTVEHFKQIKDYIDAPMTATWFRDSSNDAKPNNEKVTSELIYYWMIAYNVPFACEKWHLNRLITLIRVCEIKSRIQNGKNKMSKRAIMNDNQILNAQRRARMNSKG